MVRIYVTFGVFQLLRMFRNLVGVCRLERLCALSQLCCAIMSTCSYGPDGDQRVTKFVIAEVQQLCDSRSPRVTGTYEPISSRRLVSVSLDV